MFEKRIFLFCSENKYFLFNGKILLSSSIALSKYMMTHRIVTSLSLGLKLGDNETLIRSRLFENIMT